MATKTQLISFISGSNTGIGLAVATALARDHGHHVIIGSRNSSAGAEAAKSITDKGYSASSVKLDLASDEDIATAVKYVEENFGRLDVLINNAGTSLDLDKSLTTRQLYQQTFATNVEGAAVLTSAFLPLLRAATSPHLVFVSSRMGSLDQTLNKETMYYAMDYSAYDASKAALNMLALNYVRILDGKAKVNVACPGLVATKLTGFTPYGTTVENGAKRIVQLATLGEEGENGTFSDSNGVIPW